VDWLIDFAAANLIGVGFVLLGLGSVAYSCFAKRISFQGDFPLTREERKTYKATPAVRKRAILISLLPLLYGLFLLLYPLIKLEFQH
jgi:hypothetical protein